jgi:NADPH:quinone reductase
MKQQGAHYTYNHKDDPTYAQKILTDSVDGVDMVIEMLANVNLETDIGLLRKNGIILVVGNRGVVNINPRGLMLREADVRGVALAHANDEESCETFKAIQEGLASGFLRPVVGDARLLSEIADAHRDILTTKRLGKMVVRPWSQSDSCL